VRNPKTANHLTIKFNPVTYENEELTAIIKKRLAEDTMIAENRRVSIKASTLQKIAETLSDVSKELNALCAREKKK
jgi:hypothetical protein